MKRVVVTGIGTVSPLGNSLEESWRALKAGSSGTGPATRFDISDLPWKAAGELKGFSPDIPEKDLKRLDAFIHYAHAAARMAVRDAGVGNEDLESAGVVIGSSRGGVSALEGGLRARPTAYLMSGTTVSTACSSGANAIGEAFRLIKHGYCKVVLAGGAEAPICKLCVKGYGVSGALSKSGVSRPFDRRRDGFLIAEGAAVLVLEELASALRRGARPYGEVVGYGNTSDAFHQTMPERYGQARAIRAALEEAKVGAGDVGFISAHATSTTIGDMTEADAIRLVFGDYKVPVTAAKSMTGHMLGASGAFEAAMALMSIVEGVIPPTINLEDPEGGLNYMGEAMKADIRVAVSNSFGFGGVNAVLVLMCV
jgi:3-oxoacyl-[acyl-carrier-protein] synthase II